MTGKLAPEVRSLVARHLHSVGELDLLMLLHSDRERGWTAEAVCETLRCPPSWAALQLQALRVAGLAREAGGRWRFAAADRELDRAADALADAYRTRKADVVRLVFAQPSRDLQAFSDAFRLRQDEE